MPGIAQEDEGLLEIVVESQKTGVDAVFNVSNDFPVKVLELVVTSDKSYEKVELEVKLIDAEGFCGKVTGKPPIEDGERTMLVD